MWRLDNEDLADVVQAHGCMPTPGQVASTFGVAPDSVLVGVALKILAQDWSVS